MNMIQTAVLPTNAAIGDDPQILQDIQVKTKNIAIYGRNIKVLDTELRQIAERSIECRATGTIAEILIGLKNYFNRNLLTPNALLDDIATLLNLFQKTTQTSSFRLLLATVSTNMCSRFHTDINDLRLLCTYIGPGTLWLPDEAVNQSALTTNRGNDEIVLDEQLIQQANTGDVVILKGALYPEANPILHRSPSIEEHGENRLLLRIDTNNFLNF